MTNAEFWSLMETVERSELDDDAMNHTLLRRLVARLKLLERIELESFQEHLAQALYELDGKKFAAASYRRGWSDDGFLYSRAYVVANGKEFYDRVLANPALMPEGNEQCEQLLYAAHYAWSSEYPEEWVYDTALSYETGSNESGWRD